MPEPNRHRTKVEFRLDSRQVLLAFVGGVVLLAIAFAIGVMVGGRLSGVAGPVEDTPDLLAKLDEQEKTYQEHKTKEEAAPKVAEEKDDKTAPTPPKALPNKEKQTEKQAVAPVEPKPKKKPDPPKPKPKPAPKAEPAPPAASATDGQTPAPAGQFYTLQIASLPARAKAEEYVKNFKSFDRRKPFVTTADIPGKGTWYRVKIGKFETKEQALAYQSIFEAKTSLQTILALE